MTARRVRVCALALLALMVGAGSAVAKETVVLELLPSTPGGGGASQRAVITVTARSGASRRLQAKIPGELNLPQTKVGPYPLTLSLSAPGLWAEPLHLAAPGQLKHWEIWRTAPLRLVFHGSSAKTRLPARVKVAFEACPDRRGRRIGPKGTVEVPVKRGKAEADLPQACLDLEILTHRFAPISVPGVLLSDGKPHTLSRLTLRRGASISGRIVSALDGLGVAGVTVRVRAIKGGAPGRALETCRTDVRGHYRFAGLSPGSYLVEALKGGSVMARVRTAAAPGAETTLDDVEVGPPAVLHVAVAPADCMGRPWKVCVSPRGETAALKCADTRASGEAELKGLPAGDYSVAVTATCSRSHEIVASEDLTLGWGDRASIELSPSLCLVSGVVTVAGQPLSAELTFNPENVGISIVRAHADEEGRYSSLLPGAGTYRVELSGDGVFWGEKKDVRSCPADLDIDLPDTLVRGHVLTEEEDAAPGATVTAVAAGPGRPEVAKATADDDGAFAFRGLRPGSWRLRAERAGQASAWKELSLSEGLPPADTVLVLHRERSVRLRVVDSVGSPEAGARVAARWICSDPSGQPLDGGRMGTTDRSGMVELQVPEACSELQVLAGAEGRPLAMDRLRVAADLTVTIPNAGGKLRLFGEPRFWNSFKGPFLALVHNGFVAAVQELAQWNTILNEPMGNVASEFITPVLAPGNYSLIMAPSFGSLRAMSTNPALAVPLVNLRVEPGQTLDVDLARVPGLAKGNGPG